MENKVKQNLEKIKGAVIYWQSRDTGNIGNKTQNKDKQNNNKNITLKTKKTSNTNQTMAWNQVLVKDKLLSFLIKRPPCW